MLACGYLLKKWLNELADQLGSFPDAANNQNNGDDDERPIDLVVTIDFSLGDLEFGLHGKTFLFVG
jgi:hypothetical protein